MKKTALLLVVAAILVSVQSWNVRAEESRTLTGLYRWTYGDSGALRAVFTATGEETWDVVFHFRFRERKHTYAGTAEGNLSEGGLKGRVQNENKRRTFTFRGEFKNGKFRGTHAEVNGDRESRTGTLTLK